MYLKEFERNIQSQFGEDGIIAEIFNRIGIQDYTCVEFGAWDGIHHSNTWNLWHNENWNALLIEGHKERYQILIDNTKAFSKVKTLNKYVANTGADSLDNILFQQNIDKNFDLLSIDIDGNDYYVFKNLINFRPKVIIVEYNPTIPAHLNIIQSEGDYFGASALALLKLGHLKGYNLCHMTDTNMFFVAEEHFKALDFEEPSLASVFIHKYLAYAFSSYDGKMFIAGESPYGDFKLKYNKDNYPTLINDQNIRISKVLISEL